RDAGDHPPARREAPTGLRGWPHQRARGEGASGAAARVLRPRHQARRLHQPRRPPGARTSRKEPRMSFDEAATPAVSPEEFGRLTQRVEAIEAFILRRPTEPIPQSIIDQAIEAQNPAPTEPEPEAEEVPDGSD